MSERLTGTSEQTVDERHRVALIAKQNKAFRTLASETDPDALDPEKEFSAVISLGTEGRLCVFPKKVHEDLLAWLDRQPAFDPGWRRVRAMILGSTEEVKVDKQNRVKLPQPLAGKLGLYGTIIVRGVGDYFELMSRSAWEKEAEEFPPLMIELGKTAVP